MTPTCLHVRVFLLGSSLSLLACAGPMAAVQVPAPGATRWVRSGSAAIGLEVDLPTAPRVQARVSAQPDGTPLRLTTGASVVPGMLELGFVVAESELPMTGDPVLMLDQFTPDHGRAQLVEQRVSIDDGFPTRTAVFATSNDRVHVFHGAVGRRRLYVLVATLERRRLEELSPYVDHFLESVVLDASDAPGVLGSGEFDGAAPGWHYEYPLVDHFAVLLPGAPRSAETSMHHAGRDYPARVYGSAARTGVHAYELRVIEVGGRAAPELLDALGEVLLGGDPETADHGAPHQGFATRSLARSTPGVRTIVRLVVTDLRVYALRARVPETLAAAPATAAFLNSLRLF